MVQPAWNTPACYSAATGPANWLASTVSALSDESFDRWSSWPGRMPSPGEVRREPLAHVGNPKSGVLDCCPRLSPARSLPLPNPEESAHIVGLHSGAQKDSRRSATVRVSRGRCAACLLGPGARRRCARCTWTGTVAPAQCCSARPPRRTTSSPGSPESPHSSVAPFHVFSVLNRIGASQVCLC